jgi:predicted alpha/beta-hydrolase family hydrolase
MQLENRKIQVSPDIHVSSVWAVPDDYRGSNGSAIILAHGAGNDMDHPFMSHFHTTFAAAGLLSVKFNFPYKESGRKAPDRMPVLESTWRAVIRAVRDDPNLAPEYLYLAGKSMGGRVASLVAAQGESCAGLIFFGYPLHPAKQFDKRRVEHWANLSCPVLFVQGTRDALCDLDALKAELPRIRTPVTLRVVGGGDHSFKVPKSIGKSQDGVLLEVGMAVTDWIRKTNHDRS